MSRQKLVFPTSEVFHLWANQTQPEARNSQGNVFFEGTKIWSYGKHYLLAEIHPKHDAVIFNVDSYSTTTSKHQSKAKRAIDKWKYFNHFSIPDCDIFKAGEYYLSEIEKFLKLALKAKSKKFNYQNSAAWCITSAIQLNSAFPGQMFIPAQLQHYFNNPLELTPEQISAHKQQQQQKRQIEKQRQLDLLKENEEKIQEWITGERVSLPYGIDKVYLREISYTNDDDTSIIRLIQTSKGATVPYYEAKEFFNYLQTMPGEIFAGIFTSIGNYQIRGFKDNILTIGCHQITMDEINRFAASQGWTKNSIEITEPTLN